jgi:hypothetical protein
MVDIEFVPLEIIVLFYFYLDFVSHIHFSGTCSTFWALGKKLMPRDEDFDKKKESFIVARATSPLIWEGNFWMKIRQFGDLYEKFFYSFNRVGIKFRDFALAIQINLKFVKNEFGMSRYLGNQKISIVVFDRILRSAHVVQVR